MPERRLRNSTHAFPELHSQKESYVINRKRLHAYFASNITFEVYCVGKKWAMVILSPLHGSFSRSSSTFLNFRFRVGRQLGISRVDFLLYRQAAVPKIDIRGSFRNYSFLVHG